MPGVNETLAVSPVTDEGGEEARTPERGVALCLSGGGYRAMLFHVGALWRLNELRLPAEARPRLERVRWLDHGGRARTQLAAPRASTRAASPARSCRRSSTPLAEARRATTIDEGSILGGILTPGRRSPRRSPTPTASTSSARDTLQDLPDDPRFVINATNVQTGSLWRFSKPYMADYRVGLYPESRRRARRRRGRVVGVSAGAVTGPPVGRPRRAISPRSAADRCTSRRTRPTSC